jgi:hypothetical protein
MTAGCKREERSRRSREGGRQFSRFLVLDGFAAFALHGLAALEFALALQGLALHGLALHGFFFAAHGSAEQGLAAWAAALHGLADCAAAGAWASASPPATAIMAARLIDFIIVS